MDLHGKRVGVMGLGMTGVAVADFLIDRGARVVVSEARPESALEETPARLRAAGVHVETGRHSDGIFEGCDVVIVSPGVPPGQEALDRARDAGARVWSEIELASRYLKGRIAGITGSNGKSTVTALAAAMLNESGLQARPCGNIGLPLIALAGPPAAQIPVRDLERDEALGGDCPERIYVTEISSFQLEGIESFRPEVGALLNLSPDHMDRYDSPEDYYAAKARLFQNQGPEDTAILNGDDPRTWSLAGSLRARVHAFSLRRGGEAGVHLREDGRFVRINGEEERFLFGIADLKLPGRHNQENAAAAAAVALALGADPAFLAPAVRGFPGLPHRLRHVGSIRGVDLYDDSKATNAGSAARAVEAFDRPVILLLGGRHKGGDLAPLVASLSGRVRSVLTFGEAGSVLQDALAGELPVRCAGDLEQATSAALEEAREGDVVLLAPACASFDAYPNYAARGDHFIRIVHRLSGGKESA